MRAVFFGTPELAVPTLAAVAHHHDVTAVVCQPDRPQGRSRKPVPPATKVWALEHGVPVMQPKKLNDGTFEAWLKEQSPDVCPLAAYGRLLKEPVLDVPKHGFINMHPSLLPRHRGPSPIQTAILVGDEVTGVTIMRLSLEMDAGDILLQVEEAVRPDDTAVTLSERLGRLGADLMARALSLIEKDEAVFTPQDHAQATYTKLLKKEDGLIRWAASARDINNLVRAVVSWPAAHCLYNKETYRILATEPLEEETDAPPGTVVRVERDQMVVATGRGTLALLRIQPPGKRAMAVADFLRGHAVGVGELFEDI